MICVQKVCEMIDADHQEMQKRIVIINKIGIYN